MCQVVNKRHMSINMKDSDIVYIGRGSIWGNSFIMKDSSEAERLRVVEAYKKALWGCHLRESCYKRNADST